MSDIVEQGHITPEKRALLARLLGKKEKVSVSGENRAVLSSIVPESDQRYEPFPLTDVQRAYWLGRSGAFELGDVACHGYSEIESTELELERFETAWQRLVERHDMLRVIIRADGQQQILEQVPPYRIAVIDLRGQDPDTVAARLEAIRQQMSHQVLSIDEWPLFEIRASLLDEKRIRLHISTDALMSDVSSAEILQSELVQLYHDLDAPLAPLELSFRDYVMSEVAFRETEQYQKSLEYWRGRLPTLPPAPELPLARNPASISQQRFVRRIVTLEPEVWLRLKARAAEMHVTPSVMLLAAYAGVLAVWSKAPRFTINLTLFNRRPIHPQVNEIMGDFTSLTLLEVPPFAQDEFGTWVCRIREQFFRDLAHRYVSGVHVLDELSRLQGKHPGELTMPVVFTSMLGMERQRAVDNMTSSEMTNLGEVIYNIGQTPQVWLDSQVYERGDTLVSNWDVVEGLFPEGLLDEMVEAYRHLLHRLAEDEAAWQATVPQLVLVPVAQLEQRAAINTTKAPVSGELLHTLFATQAQERLGQPAVITSSRSLTYAELQRRANQIGHWLRENGVQPNKLVAVVMERGWEQVAAVLGILNAGAAYLPVAVDLPQERISYLLEHAQVELVLTLPWVEEKLTWPTGVQRLSVDDGELEGLDDRSLEVVQGIKDLAYVIYTSGSTGQPKGVMIDHRGAVNTILDINQRFRVTPEDRVLAVSALNFDLSVYDIFGVLAAGGAIVIPDAEGRRDPAHWLDLMRREGVTLWNSVPALMEMLVEYVADRTEQWPDSLRLVLMSGDWIPLNLPERIKALAGSVEVWSGGGATEASIWSILYPIEDVDPLWTSIPYGKPMVNQSFHVLDEALASRPVWVPGQLYIGGLGLAQGYWRDEEKTAASFVTHPRTGERLYRTGDLGRYLPDGNIEFLGREDFQVKIRGHRIELGEIEASLMQHPGVQAGVVAAVGEPRGSKRLVAHIVPDMGEELSSNLFKVKSEKPLPALWRSVVEAAQQQAHLIPPGVNSQVSLAHDTRMDRLTREYICLALKQLGAFVEPGERHSVEDLIGRYQILPRYEKVLLQWLNILEEDGLLEREEGGVFASPLPLPTEPLDELWDEIRQGVDDEGKVENRLLDVLQLCGQNLAVMLTGETDPLELLFPGGSWETADSLYQLNPLAQYHNGIVAQVLRAAASRGSSQRPIRILEIGAGTGGTTVSLLPVLPADRTVYVYTDLSTFFTNRASMRFNAYPFVEYNLLDIEKPPQHQGYELHSFDVVVAANVLHGTRSISESLQHIRALLAPNGLLILVEATQNPRIGTISTRLIEGYSRFEDERLEDNQPNLSVARWQEKLETEGFKFAAFPEPDSAVSKGMHVLVAQAPSSVQRFDEDALRTFMRQKLPGYMIPSAFVLHDRLPLTPTGKVDRRALATLEQGVLERQEVYVAPRTQCERALVRIWAEILGIERVGVHSSFFELGGDSLFATQVVSRVREVFQVELSLRALFEEPTVAGLAKRVEEDLKSGEGGVSAPPLRPAQRDGELPLSFAQERLWFLDQLEPESTAYNIPGAVRLSGLLDVAAMKASIDEVVRRHETLRTTFASVEGRGVQVIAPGLSLCLPVVDLQGLAEQEREREVLRLAREEARRPFDLIRGPLVWVTLLRLDEACPEAPPERVEGRGRREEHILLYALHHIISDGWSMGVMLQELATLYGAFSAGEPSPLPELAIQYADYAIWQREWLSGEVLEEHLGYWTERLSGAPPTLDLPTDRLRPPVQSHRGANLPLILPANLVAGLKALSRQHEATLFMTLLAAFDVLLYRYTGQQDLVVASRVAGRRRQETEGVIGFFINPLVLRMAVSGEATFRELLDHVRAVTLGAYAHQDLPFEMLVDKLHPERDLSRNPLFQVMFVLQNFPQPAANVSGLSIQPIAVEGGQSVFDIDFSLNETTEGVEGTVEYNTDLFDADTITRLVKHYKVVLEQMVDRPDMCLSEVSLLTEVERQQVLVEWNTTQAHYPQETCLHELFAAQVERTPDSVAVMCGDERVTYETLNRRANQLGHYLQSLGVGPEVPVGVCMERSPQVVLALLGILKAGGVYVPLDPTYPQKHLTCVLEDTRAAVLLTSKLASQCISESANSASKPVLVRLDTDWETIAGYPESDPVMTVRPGNLGHIVYTSGSTGKPKGVLVEQRQLLNRLAWRWQTHPFQPGEVMVQRTAMSFSVALAEMLEPLLQGIAVAIVPDEVAQDAPRLVEVLDEQCVSRIVVVPSLLRVILEVKKDLQQSLARLRLWSTCGERLPVELAKRFRERVPQGRLLNQYGASEVNDVTCYDSREWPEGTSVPIGRPLNNSKVYLLDERMELVGIGLPGEVYISSVGLSRGYLKRPALTAERFVPDPFSGHPGGRLYRMGDVARYLSDSNLEYVGRRDHQVKVRGIRLELEGIEALLKEYPAVNQAVVVWAAGRGEEDKRLVAYVVAKEGQKPTRGELRHHLKTRLPESVIPTAFVFLNTLPLTPNGKVDRQALPAPRQGVCLNADEVAQILEQVKQLSEDQVESMLDELKAPAGLKEH
jgi:amino acid adenylation domain-containing protein